MPAAQLVLFLPIPLLPLHLHPHPSISPPPPHPKTRIAGSLSFRSSSKRRSCHTLLRKAPELAVDPSPATYLLLLLILPPSAADAPRAEQRRSRHSSLDTDAHGRISGTPYAASPRLGHASPRLVFVPRGRNVGTQAEPACIFRPPSVGLPRSTHDIRSVPRAPLPPRVAAFSLRFLEPHRMRLGCSSLSVPVATVTLIVVALHP
ncbi:hypothetical protein RJ55_04521 [Drechmeria coniospora]|nr:hypothetical protein RJ55_04521 [Drechmeria coniospora]